MVVQAAVAAPTPVEGQLIQGPWAEETESYTTEGALQAGRLLAYGTDRATQAAEMGALPAADPNAIMLVGTFLSNALTATTYTGAQLDGVIGGDRIAAPCRTVTVTFDADAGWDTPSGACRVDIYGHDADGGEVHDTIQKENGSGAGTYTTAIVFASVYRIDVEATNANTGAGTVGVSNARMECSPADYAGIALYNPAKEPNTASRNFAYNEPFSTLRRGRIAAVPEHAVTDGDQVYVRVLAAGADLAGQMTGQDGAATPGTYAKLAGAKWRRASVADAMSIVELAGV
jgi:hypothetical protein